jgi:peroxidase
MTLMRKNNARRGSFACLTIYLLFFPAGPAWAGGTGSSEVTLLKEFRRFGGVNNHITYPTLCALPGNAELSLAPLNFAAGTNDGLMSGPNPRTISNVIAGGKGAAGNDAQTTDPALSAWLYAFGQFVDHDLDLEATPLVAPPINIVVPAGDPLYKAGRRSR